MPIEVVASRDTAPGHSASPVSGLVFNSVISVTPPPPPPPPPEPKSYGPEIIVSNVP